MKTFIKKKKTNSIEISLNLVTQGVCVLMKTIHL